jgi:starch synthase (maltosyl-transferring)
MTTKSAINLPTTGIKRTIIKRVKPSVQYGTYPAKGTIGEPIRISAIVLADGHDKIFARALLRHPDSKTWLEIEMHPYQNDEWYANYIPNTTGVIEFKIQAWVSDIESWKDGFLKKQAASLDTKLEALQGFKIIEEALKEAPKADHKELKHFLNDKKEAGVSPEDIDSGLYKKLIRAVSKERITSSETYRINIERVRARFSTWYELFPRSCSPEEGQHGTLRDVARKLPELAAAGFNVIYLPPVHPIGTLNRKGKNNSLTAMPNDPGSPWAIGSHIGGHKSIHPELGTMEDFKALVKETKKLHIELAMDIAFQCAPDHPYVQDHPEWFKWRPDGSVQFAENPPKKYEDILPFDFETDAWESLWKELLSIFMFWIDKGIRIFRVDNPHTKSLRLWEWLIETIQKEYPETIFLAEAFTRPNVMEHLAMAGFTQSYTYFTWRNSKAELEAYMKELTTTSKQYYFRPNFWPNTPDILPEHLVSGGENMHIIRVLLAATLSSNYGIYGPVFEQGINQQMPGKEEYNDNEKYEIKHWPKTAPTKIWEVIKKINHLRNTFNALQTTPNIRFLNTSNDSVMAYLKLDVIGGNHLLIIINLDVHHLQSAWVQLTSDVWKAQGTSIHLKDELNDASYDWNEEWNYVELEPDTKPAHIFSIS